MHGPYWEDFTYEYMIQYTQVEDNIFTLWLTILNLPLEGNR